MSVQVIVMAVAVGLAVLCALALGFALALRRAPRTRYGDVIPTWGDAYREGLARAHRKRRRTRRLPHP